jgi:hypothetical protein
LAEEEKISTSIKMLSEIQRLAKDAKSKSITVELHNFEGQPFKVVTRPGGLVADWGVGGVSRVNLGEKVVRPATTLNRVVRK